MQDDPEARRRGKPKKAGVGTDAVLHLDNPGLCSAYRLSDMPARPNMPGTCASRARRTGRAVGCNPPFGSAGNIEACAWRSPSLGLAAVGLEFVISIYTRR